MRSFLLLPFATFVVCLVSIIASHDHVMVHAQSTPKHDLENFRAASANMIDEALSCSVYFSIAKAGLERRRPIDASSVRVINQYELAKKHMIDLAFAIAPQIGISGAALLAKQKLATEDAKTLTQNSMANFSVLIVKHAKPCDFLLKHSEKRLEQLLLRERNR